MLLCCDRGIYYCGDLDEPPVLAEARTRLTRWIKDADVARKALLENCEDCPSLPAEAKKIAAEQRQVVGPLLGSKTLINGAI